MAERIVAIVVGSKNGVSAEGIKAALKVQRKELPKPLAMALASKRVRKRGVKRATTYFKA
jgi:hypothetical protein